MASPGSDGLYAYLFVKDVKAVDASVSQVIGEVRSLIEAEGGPVRVATEVVGAYKALVAIEVAPGDLAGLQDFLGGADYGGVVFDWDRFDYELVIEGPVYVNAVGGGKPPKRPGCDVVAFVRVSVEAGRAREVLGRLGDELGPTFHGAAIMFGGTDIFLTLEASKFEKVAQAALAKLHQIPGVTATETSFADLRRYEHEEP
jgi:DNA-binding Lrp family transcriptional regulator